MPILGDPRKDTGRVDCLVASKLLTANIREYHTYLSNYGLGNRHAPPQTRERVPWTSSINAAPVFPALSWFAWRIVLVQTRLWCILARRCASGVWHAKVTPRWRFMTSTQMATSTPCSGVQMVA